MWIAAVQFRGICGAQQEESSLENDIYVECEQSTTNTTKKTWINTNESTVINIYWCHVCHLTRAHTHHTSHRDGDKSRNEKKLATIPQSTPNRKKRTEIITVMVVIVKALVKNIENEKKRRNKTTNYSMHIPYI